MDNYAVIENKKIALSKEMVNYISKNFKEYNIDHLVIRPNWSDGYCYDDGEEGSIYLADKDDLGYGISITYEELPKVIESLIEIYDYLKLSKKVE